MESKKSKITIYMFCFYLLIIIRVFIYINFDGNFVSPLLKMITSNIFRFLLWVMPVFIYLIFVDKANPFRFLKLNTSLRKGFLWSIGILLLGAMWQFASIRLGYDKIGQISSISVIGLLIISICEEILMRGFILNKLSEITSFPMALLITSVFFVAIHYPGWLLINHHSSILIIKYSLSILIVVALPCGYLVRKSNSLFPAIVLHSVNNFISSL